LFLDDPTSGLDPEAVMEVRELMDRLSRYEKHTIPLYAHRLEDPLSNNNFMTCSLDF